MAATTYNRAVTQYVGDTTSDLFIRDVSKFPELIKRTDFPLFTSIKTGPPLAQPKLKLEWGIRHLPPVNDTITTGTNNVGVTITPANIGFYQVGHVLLFAAGDKAVVSAVGASDLTIVRDFGGTTGATIANSSGVRIIGIAVKENAETPLGPMTQGEVDYNYFQIFDKGLKLSNRARKTPTYEIKDDRLRYFVKQTLEIEMPSYMEETLLWGTRSLGSTTAASSMGGVFQTSYVGNQVDLSGDILTEYQFLEGMQKAYAQVGAANVGGRVMSHPFYKRIAANWTKDMRRMEAHEKTVDMRVETFATDFGTVEWMINHRMKSVTDPTLADGRILIFDPSDYTLRPYSEGSQWAEYAVAEGGWYSIRAIRGDYSLEAINPEKRVGYFNLSNTALDYPYFVNP